MFAGLNFQPRANVGLVLHSPEMRDDLKTFFGPRAEKYLKLFDREAQGGNVWMGWDINWSILFGGFVWFFYRRLYLYGALAMLVPIIVIVLFGNAGLGGIWGAVAAMAKPFYYQIALARVRKADSLGLTGAERADYLRRAGGVSPVAGILAALVFVALLALVVLRFVRPDLLR